MRLSLTILLLFIFTIGFSQTVNDLRPTVTMKEYNRSIFLFFGLYKFSSKARCFLPIIPRLMSLERIRSFFLRFFSTHIIFPMTLNTKHPKIFSFSGVREVFNFSPFVLFRLVETIRVFAFVSFPKINTQPQVKCFVPNIVTFPHRVISPAKITPAYLTFALVGAATNIFSNFGRSKAHNGPAPFTYSFCSYCPAFTHFKLY